MTSPASTYNHTSAAAAVPLQPIAEDWDEHEPMVVGLPVTNCQECEKRQQQERNQPSLPGIEVFAAISFTIFLLATYLYGGNGQGISSIMSRSNDDVSSQPPHRAFVCITGQVNRLELDNKIGAVLHPLRQAGYEPDVALILDDSSKTPHVTNDQKIKIDYTRNSAFDTFDDAVVTLRNLDFTVLTDSPYIQVENPILNEEYVNQLQQKEGMTNEQHSERSKNNVRMMESWSQCYTEMSRDLERSLMYDIVVRVREDAGFIEALDVDFLVDQLNSNEEENDEGAEDEEESTGTVISNGCRQSHGMNDKFAVVSRNAAESYFLAPLRYYYTKPLNPNVISSESFIYYTYLDEGLTVLKPPEIRSVVKVITDEHGNTILFPGEKKTLIHMCRVSIHDESAPNACATTWDADNRDLQQASDVCFPFKMKDPTCETCK